MSAVLSPPIKLAPYLYRYTWTGTAPFRIFDYYEYRYMRTNTSDLQMDVVSPFRNQAPAFQVLDATDGAIDGETYPGLARVQWRGQKEASKYEVDNGITILNWTPETGRGYYEYVFQHSQLGFINDAIVNLTAYNLEGNTVASQARALSAVSVPLMFEFQITYTAGTNTILVGLA